MPLDETWIVFTSSWPWFRLGDVSVAFLLWEYCGPVMIYTIFMHVTIVTMTTVIFIQHIRGNREDERRGAVAASLHQARRSSRLYIRTPALLLLLKRARKAASEPATHRKKTEPELLAATQVVTIIRTFSTHVALPAVGSVDCSVSVPKLGSTNGREVE